MSGSPKPMSIHQITGHLISWLNHESSPSELPLCDFERFRHELKPCDVILVEGRSRVSSVIRLITASPWTHAALYIGRIHDIEDEALREALRRYCEYQPNEQLIIESVLGKGTIVNKLSFYQKDHIRICRPTGLSYKDAQQVIRYAISRLGAEYDVRQIFDLARFLFPWFLLPRRWRSSLFKRSAGDSTRTVCSTMIAEAFGFIQFPILPLVKKVGQGGVQLFRRNPKICVPSDFDYSPHFEIIKYPFIDMGLHKDYRLLPWKGSGQLSAEEAKLYFEHEEIETSEAKTTNDAGKVPVDLDPDAVETAEPEEMSPEINTPPTAPKSTVSTFKLVANKLEDALPKGWRDSGNTQAVTVDETPEKIPAQNVAHFTAEVAQDNALQVESTLVESAQASSAQASQVKPDSDSMGKDSTDSEKPTMTVEEAGANNQNDAEDKMALEDDLNDNEASAVEKWLRSITSSRPKSDD